MHGWLRAACLVALLWLVGFGTADQVGAQEAQPAPPAQPTAAALDPLLEQARKDGMTVIVMQPATAAQAEAPPAVETGWTEQSLALRNEVQRLLRHSADIPRRAGFALEIASPDGTMTWLLRAIIIATVGLLLGYLPARWLEGWARGKFASRWNPAPTGRSQKIGYLLFRAGVMTLILAVQIAVATLVAILFDNGHPPTRITEFIIIKAVAAWQLRTIIFANLLAPNLPAYRMVTLTDAEASAVDRDLRWAFGISILTFSLADWLHRIDLDGDALKLSLIAATLLSAVVTAVLIVRHRSALRHLCEGAAPAHERPAWRGVLGALSDEVALAYLLAAVAVTVVRILLGLPSATLLVAAPAIAFVGAVVGYGVMLLLIDWVYRGRSERWRRHRDERALARRHDREREARALAEAQRGEAEDTVIVANLAPRQQPEAPYRPLYKPLLERAAALLVVIGAMAFVLHAWDVRIGGRNPVVAFMGTVLTLFLAWFLMRALTLLIERRMEEERGPETPLEDLEGGGQGTSRLATLLPLLRNVMIAAIAIVAVMIVLSNLGVDVAPLFAGAGVVGLAVGFGAQTLIRDIFSGGFFLFDDAFRKGEYVELGNVRGVVEKISLRSFQLRHHNGPLHTIPFGEIKQLTNYSRDWVIMKLPLRLTYDTDIEKVRKLVKKLGQELLSHPEVGRHFLQPLKSQGVVEMDDSALVVRVKFMTRPNEQWQTRKVVYAEIQKLFARERIRFANREVTVRIADDEVRDDPELREKAATAAARSVIEEADRKAALG